MESSLLKRLSVFSGPSRSPALTSENSGFVLFVQPLEEFFKSRVGQNGIYVIERVPKLIMTPRLVDEILT
jgi:hypothetical protein